jgi:hypothetical protein
MSPFSSTTNWRRNAGSSEFYRSSPKFTQPSASPDVNRIRHYGLLASAARQANIARARELLAAPEPPTAPDATTKATATAPTDHRPPCPCCGGRMIVIETFERGGGPRDPPRPEPGIRTEAA